MTKPRTSFDGGSKSSLPGTRSSLMKDFGDFAELDTDISFVSSDKPNTDRNSSLMFDSFVDCNRNSRFSTSTDPIKEINCKASQSASLGLDHNISPANYNLNRSKRQTKLCVLYQRGHCSRQSCSFAHGDADLRGFSGSHGGSMRRKTKIKSHPRRRARRDIGDTTPRGFGMRREALRFSDFGEKKKRVAKMKKCLNKVSTDMVSIVFLQKGLCWLVNLRAGFGIFPAQLYLGLSLCIHETSRHYEGSVLEGSIIVLYNFSHIVPCDGKRKYRNGDLRDKLDRRLSPERRYSPNRDARDQQTLRGHSPLRSIDKRR
ncbi:hypothetical protein V6N11_021485 [Hibiscus sabdariffa]|uniref:C3H1-type domain-containing protein n=1 Tax=Hibiscus sabdariffa TaxID=183260 RepID=A0ABR1ZKN6_9ROSI